MSLSTPKKIAILESFGYTIGERDPRLNTNYPGTLMVVEATAYDIDDYSLPTEDGGDGPWCVVGDDLDDLVESAYDCLSSLDAPKFPEILASIENLDDADLPPRRNTSLVAPPAPTPSM